MNMCRCFPLDIIINISNVSVCVKLVSNNMTKYEVGILDLQSYACLMILLLIFIAALTSYSCAMLQMIDLCNVNLIGFSKL